MFFGVFLVLCFFFFKLRILKLDVALQYLCFHSAKKIPVMFEGEWIWLLSLLVLAPFFADIENGRRGISFRNTGRKLKSDLKLK